MSILDFFRAPDINRGAAEWAAAPGAMLLDVRTSQEYAQGHIPGSVNLPLQSIDSAEKLIDNKNISIYVYCQSGARSARASAALRRMGFTEVKNIGGIAAYTGKVAH